MGEGINQSVPIAEQLHEEGDPIPVSRLPVHHHSMAEVTGLTAALDSLNTVVGGKADQSALTALAAAIADEVNTLTAGLASKADASDLAALAQTVADLPPAPDLSLYETTAAASAALAGKADASALAAFARLDGAHFTGGVQVGDHIFVNSDGSADWNFGDVGQISFGTPGGFPGFNLWQGSSGFTGARFIARHRGTYFEQGFASSPAGAGTLKIGDDSSVTVAGNIHLTGSNSTIEGSAGEGGQGFHLLAWSQGFNLDPLIAGGNIMVGHDHALGTFRIESGVFQVNSEVPSIINGGLTMEGGNLTMTGTNAVISATTGGHGMSAVSWISGFNINAAENGDTLYIGKDRAWASVDIFSGVSATGNIHSDSSISADGNISTSANVVGGQLVSLHDAFFHGSVNMLNKSGSDYIAFAVRDTTGDEARWNLSNIGNAVAYGDFISDAGNGSGGNSLNGLTAAFNSLSADVTDLTHVPRWFEYNTAAADHIIIGTTEAGTIIDSGSSISDVINSAAESARSGVVLWEGGTAPGIEGRVPTVSATGNLVDSGYAIADIISAASGGSTPGIEAVLSVSNDAGGVPLANVGSITLADSGGTLQANGGTYEFTSPVHADQGDGNGIQLLATQTWVAAQGYSTGGGGGGIAWNGSYAGSGNVVVGDGMGSVQDSGVALSSIAGAPWNGSPAGSGNLVLGDGMGAISDSGISYTLLATYTPNGIPLPANVDTSVTPGFSCIGVDPSGALLFYSISTASWVTIAA